MAIRINGDVWHICPCATLGLTGYFSRKKCSKYQQGVLSRDIPRDAPVLLAIQASITF